MPLTDEDHADLLRTLRGGLHELGLGSMDERISLRVRGAENPYQDLEKYLVLLIEEISLGTDESVRHVLSRFQEIVETKSGETVQGIRVELSAEEVRRYGRQYVDLGRPQGTAEAAQEHEALSDLRHLLVELRMDYQGRAEQGWRE